MTYKTRPRLPKFENVNYFFNFTLCALRIPFQQALTGYPKLIQPRVITYLVFFSSNQWHTKLVPDSPSLKIFNYFFNFTLCALRIPFQQALTGYPKLIQPRVITYLVFFSSNQWHTKLVPDSPSLKMLIFEISPHAPCVYHSNKPSLAILNWFNPEL